MPVCALALPAAASPARPASASATAAICASLRRVPVEAKPVPGEGACDSGPEGAPVGVPPKTTLAATASPTLAARTAAARRRQLVLPIIFIT